jgi:murein DD-endopeptidase MepM/ murein hydrolase activator NlpD
MRIKVATIIVLAALLATAALVSASGAGADPVGEGTSVLGSEAASGSGSTGLGGNTAAVPACSNGVDDDGDGLVDMEDPDCENPQDTSEAPTPPATTAGTPTTPAPETTSPAPVVPPTTAPADPAKPGKTKGKGQDGSSGKSGAGDSGDGGVKQGESLGGGEGADKTGGVTHNESLGDVSGGGGHDGAVKAPSATGGGDQPLDETSGDGGSPFGTGGAPTLANPTTTIAPFGPAPIGVPNFVIDSFEIPPFLLPIYQACGTEYGIPWEVLASINKIETGFGTNLNVSSAGAVGWMQFLPSSWEAYGLDANGDGRKDPYNPVDAICAAAHYLKVAGGQKDLYDAILAYNHADWYAQEVLTYARAYGKLPSGLVGSLTGLTEGAHFPVAADARYADDVSARAAIEGSKQDGRISSSAAEIISSSPTRRGINIFSGKGAPVVAVNDGVIRKMGRAPGMGKFVVLEDTYGNRYTYAELGKVVRDHRTIVTPGGKEERLPEATESRPRLRALPDRGAGEDATAAGESNGRERLSAGGDSTAAAKKIGGNEAARGFGAHNEAETEVKPAEGRLKVGSKVIAGTVIGRIGAARRGVDPHVNFSIRPAGKGAPRIDPKPILDGWKLLEATAIYRAKGKNPFDKRLSGAGVLLLSKEALERRVLADKGLQIYPCGREDIETGQIDRRVLATLEYLRATGFEELTITALKCGHSYLTSSGNVSEHTTGDAVDIADIDEIPVTGHQGEGTLADKLIKDVLTLQGTMTPHQVISLEDLPGEISFALPDHYDHVHIGFRPIEAGNPFEAQQSALLNPEQWQRLIDRLGQIKNPEVPIGPSKFSVPDEVSEGPIRSGGGTKAGGED